MDKKEYLFQRRNRCVGRLLGELEGIVPEEMMGQVRRAVKTRIGEYHSDVLGVIDDVPSTRFNAIAMRLKDSLGYSNTHRG